MKQNISQYSRTCLGVIIGNLLLINIIIIIKQDPLSGCISVLAGHVRRALGQFTDLYVLVREHADTRDSGGAVVGTYVIVVVQLLSPT